MAPILPEIEFITFDKRATFEELRRVRRALRNERFDLLVDLQLALRASLISTLVPSATKLGFDFKRARELQWLFTNARIDPRTREHVLDSFMGFVRACGIEPGAPRWDISLPPGELEYADGIVTDDRPTLLISPCSSHSARNWSAERYAAVACHAADVHRMKVVLVGGRSALEAEMGTAIIACARGRILNKIGMDTLPQLLGLMSKSTVLLSPDSGPAHMATMVGLPVIGLYAATRTARAGPYASRQWCVDKYDAAARKYLRKTAAEIPWTTKIERPGVMDLIEAGEVAAKLDAVMAARVFR